MPSNAVKLPPATTRSVVKSPLKSKEIPTSRFVIEPIVAYYIFGAVNTVAAFSSPIQDCDEVFNYWEPTHYLTHGYGLQTWEYSPDYAIRSWLYILPHAAIGKFASLFSTKKTFEFYFIRVVLGLLCAFCQTRLFWTISRTLNPRVAVMFMLIMLTSPGMFHASAAYLPSSFAMCTAMLGTACFMDWRGGSRTNAGVMWFGIGAIIGWPFVAALILPFIVEELVLASITKEGIELLRRLLDGTVRSMIAVMLQLAVDTFFYHKPVIVSWQIVSYNVFKAAGRGPELFGTEAWDFYFRNLLLNFSLWFLLALITGPILIVQYISRDSTTSNFALFRNAFFVMPFYTWLGIFSLQAHKEERFMYPIYPFLALNAAISLHTILAYLGSSDAQRFIGKVPAKLKLAIITFILLLAVDTGILRIIGLLTAYRAPLQIYSPLFKPGMASPEKTLCLGKEWYRFPSSYFLPNGMHVKFIRSEFNGLLPGEFKEANVGFGFFPGTWLVPPGMNDQNVADPGKYINVQHCSFLVDSSLSSSEGSAAEPKYALDTETWDTIKCESFLDATGTSMIGRAIWLPNWFLIPNRHQRQWGEYCLLKRRTK